MKQISLAFIFVLLSSSLMNAQFRNDFNNPKTDKDAKTVRELPNEERKAMMKRLHEEALLESLKISESHKEAFKTLYGEYYDAQSKIKSNFNNNFDPETLSNDEAKRKLEESFNLGQKLMDNRREYAKKLQTVLSPQQILKLFQNEGKMRHKVLNRKVEMHGNKPPHKE